MAIKPFLVSVCGSINEADAMQICVLPVFFHDEDKDMMGEYGVLLGANGFLDALTGLPTTFMNFLNTQNGQLSAAVLVTVLLLLYIRKR